SPLRVHTCAPCPSPLTLDDITMTTSVFDEAFSHLGPPEVDVADKSFNTPPELPKPYTTPYTYPKTFDPFESLANQFYCDLLRLSELRNKFLVFPTDVDAEVSALKAKLSDLLDV
ncbi:hypothetical protein L195_g061884, partial [Trifolium pratense]